MKFFLVFFAFSVFTAVQANICSVPDCSFSSNRDTVWPSSDPTKYYLCYVEGSVWVAGQFSCQCGTLFSYFDQSCEYPWNWMPSCTNYPNVIAPEDCETVPGPPPTVPELIPTVPNLPPTAA